MKDKPKDVPYCGVNQKKIKESFPVFNSVVKSLLEEFITERYEVHVAKDVERLMPPWTENQILQQVKFTNVRREHDRQTIFFIKNIAKSGACRKSLFWNTVMFRMFNISTPWQKVFHGLFEVGRSQDKSYQDQLRSRFIELCESGDAVFTNAFNTGGLKQSLALPEYDHDTCKEQRNGALIIKATDGSDINYKYQREDLLSGKISSPDFESFMPMRIVRYVAKVANELFPYLHDDVWNSKSQEEAYTHLLKIRGVSRFLAYQMFVDLTYVDDFPFSENHFTVSGPGCDAGLGLLFDDTSGLNSAELLFWLRDNQNLLDVDFGSLMVDVPVPERGLNVMSAENCMCELSKYVRCHNAISEGKKPRGKVSTAKLSTPPTVDVSTKTEIKTKKLW